MSISPTRSLLVVLLLAGLVAAPAPWASADDGKVAEKKDEKKDAKKEAEPPPKVELDKKSPPIVMRDTAGRSFELLDCAIARKDAEAVVRAAAQKFGAAGDAKLDTKIADLKGVKDEDGDLDESKVKELAVAAGEFYGLTATEESIAGFKTLADLVTWVAEANDAPILILTWSPRCPAVRRANDAIVEFAAKKKVRMFAIACNTRDTDEHYAQFKENFDWSVRIFPDRDQRVTDMLGGKTTPHFFLFDAKGVLRYRGALDDDPMGYMEEDERKNFVADAIAAIRAGKDVELKETKPGG